MYSPAAGLEKGAYILCDLGTGKPDIILMATGSEVSLILEAGDKLAQKGLNVRLISFPSWELFRKQSLEYQEAVLPIGIKARIAVEAGSAQGWREWVGDKGDTITIEGYGASAPAKEIFTNYGFTAENVVIKSEKLLKGLR
jgi:transketolase